MSKIVLTGHREIADRKFLADALDGSLVRLGKQGFDTLVQGMALGTDIMAGQIALSLGWKVIACIPHFGHEYRRQEDDKKRYWSLLANENTEVHYVHAGPYYKASFFARNQYMVDMMSEEDILLAVMHSEDSGTGHCVRCAREKNKRIHIFNPQSNSWSSENAP